MVRPLDYIRPATGRYRRRATRLVGFVVCVGTVAGGLFLFYNAMQPALVREQFRSATTHADRTEALESWVSLHNQGRLPPDSLFTLSDGPVNTRGRLAVQTVAVGEVEEKVGRIYLFLSGDGTAGLSRTDPIMPVDQRRSTIGWPDLNQQRTR